MRTDNKIRFLADMGISQSTISWLRSLEYDAIHLREQNLQRLADCKIIEKAKSERRVILTCDLDFGDLMASSKAKLPSIIIFRLKNQTPNNINKHLSTILNESTLHLLNGAILLVEENKHRIRILPV
jgi:predicted nuclease of predicted toxin-antitoxin system